MKVKAKTKHLTKSPPPRRPTTSALQDHAVSMTSSSERSSASACSSSPPPSSANPTTGQWQDREDMDALRTLVKQNPVLLKIQSHGSKAAKKALYPDNSGDYFFDYLAAFPDGTWALPQVFCRVIPGLNSNHWLALAAARYRERRHTNNNGNDRSTNKDAPAADDDANADSVCYGNLRPSEVERLQTCNAAFWEHYIQVRPSQGQLDRIEHRRRQQQQAARKTTTSSTTATAKTDKRHSMDSALTTTSVNSARSAESHASSSDSHTSNTNTPSHHNHNVSSVCRNRQTNNRHRHATVPLKKRRVSLDNDNNYHHRNDTMSSYSKQRSYKKARQGLVNGDTAMATATDMSGASPSSSSRRVTMETSTNESAGNASQRHGATAVSGMTPQDPVSECASLRHRISVVDKTRWKAHEVTGQFDDRNNLEQLQALVDQNPVLGFIQERGGKTPKRLLFPQDVTCEYFYEYLAAFPPGTWALPQVFCRVIKGLNSNHWMALTAMRLRDRRHHGQGPHGSLRIEEVQRLQDVNLAFYCHFVCQPPAVAVAETGGATTKQSVNDVTATADVMRQTQPALTCPAMKEDSAAHGVAEHREAANEHTCKTGDEGGENTPVAPSSKQGITTTMYTATSPTVQPVTADEALLQRQIFLQEQLLRAGLVQQQSPLLSLGAATVANATPASLYQELLAHTTLGATGIGGLGGMDVLSGRDTLPFLAANLGLISNTAGFPNQTSSTAHIDSNGNPKDAMQTLASLLSTASTATTATTEVPDPVVSPKIPLVMESSVQMAAPAHTTSVNECVDKSTTKVPLPDKESITTTLEDDTAVDDTVDADASQSESEDDSKAISREGWSMLDVLAATASVARTKNMGTE